MNFRLTRYIGRTVILSTLAALFVLLVLISFVTLMDEMAKAGKGDYAVADAFLYVLLIFPRRIYELFPASALLGSLIGLGSLASNSELVAMRSAGFSLGRILGSALLATLLMLAGVLLLGETVAPTTDQYAEGMRAERMDEHVTLKTENGFWARDGNAFVNIRQILPGARLKDVYIYDFAPDGALKQATHAESALYLENRWRLHGIHQSDFAPDRITSRTLETAIWDSLLDPSLLSMVIVEPSVLPALGLLQYIRYLNENELNATPYEVAFWGKVLMPAITLVMVFLAVPFVLGPLRSVGVGQRVFTGAMIGVGFFLVNKVLSHMAVVYGLNPLFAASFPTLLVLGLALWGFRKLY